MKMNYQQILNDVYRHTLRLPAAGELADYIPELAFVDPNKFGVHLSAVSGDQFGIGDHELKFSVQSISKVFSLTMAYGMLGESIWERMGVEPSGTRFNSLVQLESDNGIPRNPFINAGAMVVADILLSRLSSPRADLIDFIRWLGNDKQIDYSAKIAASEKSAGYRNIALCNFIKSFGNIDNDPGEVLDFYFDLCSIEMSCRQLANVFLFLANHGRPLHEPTPVLTFSQSKRMNALMQTCGFYDESGEFSFKVGLPGKSGVGGGIAAVHPGKYAIAVWSPRLNAKGNSYLGMQFLEEFTTRTQLSIF